MDLVVDEQWTHTIDEMIPVIWRRDGRAKGVPGY